MSSLDPYQEIIARLNQFQRFQKKIAVILVVKLQSDLVNLDYEAHSIITTYLSDRELNDLIAGFQGIVDYVDVVHGELELLLKLQSNYYKFLDGYHKVVYTENASGIHRSKSAHIPVLCELFDMHFCSNDIFTAALLDNKMAVFNLIDNLGLPIPQSWYYKNGSGWLGNEPPNDRKLIAKPAYECASIGIEDSSVSTLTTPFLKFIDSLSVRFNQPIILQEFIDGYEVEVPVFDGATPFIPGTCGISLNNDRNLGSNFLNYSAVFDDGFDLYNYDEFNQQISYLIKETSLKAYNCLQLRGPVRIDYRINSAGNFFITDFNNSPHLGKQHSFAFCLSHLGFSYEDMLKLILLPALF